MSAGERKQRRPVGILAGGGGLPVAVARAIVARGGQVHIVGFRGEADSLIEQFPHDWVSWGAIDAMLGRFRENGCKELVIAGTVRRPDLRNWRPDLGLLKSIPAVWSLMRGGDDSVLAKVVRFFEGHGFIVRGAHEYAPQLLASTGVMGVHAPGPKDRQAMNRAMQLIHAIAPFDVGQAVLAGHDRIIAVEGAGGTDAMIRDAMIADVRSSRHGVQQDAGSNLEGAVLVKLPKPGQEMRVDMPAIGPQTIDLMKSAGLAGVGVAAGRSLMLERETVLTMADDAGLFVCGIDDSPSAEPVAGNRVAFNSESRPSALRVLGRTKPTGADWRDIETGQRLLNVLAAHDTGDAVVISRDYVLAISCSGSLNAMLAQAHRARPWGGLLPGRRGVLVLGGKKAREGFPVKPAQSAAQGQAVEQADCPSRRSCPLLQSADLELAARQKLAGIVFLVAPPAHLIAGGFLAQAHNAGLFVVGPEIDDKTGNVSHDE